MCVSNVHVLTNAFFGCGIVKFSIKQVKELKAMCELPMIRKIGLGDKFPRKLSCVKKTSLGGGLITPQTTIDTLAMKL